MTETVAANEAERLHWDDLQDRVARELERQRDTWGEQDHDPDHWFLIVAEELGEAAKALCEGDRLATRREIVQTIACLAQLYDALT